MPLSFAGAQRACVEQVEALQARGVRCFYGADEQIDLYLRGKYLAGELPAAFQLALSCG